MNISREKTNDLELTVKLEVSEADYQEQVEKQLKNYRQRAVVPGFRKGMAPKSLIEKMYKTSVVAEEVEKIIDKELFKYLDDEQINTLGGPLSRAENESIDFSKDKDFVFCFDIALAPTIDLDWSTIHEKDYHVTVTDEDLETVIAEEAKRRGKFETPEVVGEGDFIYGLVEELNAEGMTKEGGVKTFLSFELNSLKDEDTRKSFEGKKIEDKVVFNAAKAFDAAEREKRFRLTAEVAKDFCSDMQFTISGCSHIVPHELNKEFFDAVLPNDKIEDEEEFRIAMREFIAQDNEVRSRSLYINRVSNDFVDQFTFPLPETFLKRWLLSRGEKDLTVENIDSEWIEKYAPAIKRELLNAELNKIKPLTPSKEQLTDYLGAAFDKHFKMEEGESAEERKAHRKAIVDAFSEGENSTSVKERLYAYNMYDLMTSYLHPEVIEVSTTEFFTIFNGKS